MMPRSNGTPVWIQVRRLALLTIGLAPVVLIFLIAVLWLQSNIPRWVYWKAGLIFLITLEVAYGVTVVLTILGAVVLGFLVFRGRRVASRPAVGRGLLLCVSLMLGLIAAETASAVWLHRSHRETALPVGGLSRGSVALGKSSQPAHPATRHRASRPNSPNQGRRARSIWSSWESRAPKGSPITTGCRSDTSSRWQLKEAIPARPVRVEVLAISGDTLEQQHREAERAEAPSRFLDHLLRPQRVLGAVRCVARPRPLLRRAAADGVDALR